MITTEFTKKSFVGKPKSCAGKKFKANVSIIVICLEGTVRLLAAVIKELVINQVLKKCVYKN